MLAIAAILLIAAFQVRADDPPSWLQESARANVPKYDPKDAAAVVLRNEESITIDSSGAVVRTIRYAVKVLVHEGRREALARIVYQTDGGKVRDLNAWLLRSGGTSKSYGKKEMIDVSLADNDLYNEARARLIDATDEADTGDVFGFESVQEERSVFSQFEFEFQDDLPTLISTFSLSLPAGWKAESVTFNRPTVTPVVNGTGYSWTLTDLPPIVYEPGSPSFASLAPWLAVSFYPSAATATQIKTFSNWNDVAKWMSTLEDPQMTVNDDLAAKARDLTVNAKTDVERIKAIAKYVQQTQYISLQIGTSRGGGYQPHSATEVFAKNYGDCKDKANLMRAMLSVVKIPAYLVSITADDPTFVRPEWASPHQFNHCIIAIKVGDDIDLAAVVKDPRLGRLLIFDPTDPFTQVGDLPDDEQGSYALIDHKDSDALLQMPVSDPDQNRLERRIDVSLTPEGSLQGSVIERSIGQSARDYRAEFKRMSTADYNRRIEGWISRGATGAKTSKIEPKDDLEIGDFTLNVDFAAAAYAQIMQNRLMVFKPAVVGRLERFGFSEGKRTHPYLLNSQSYTEQVRIKLPAGFAVDELPDPTKIETAFGMYSANYETSGDQVVFTRTLKVKRSTIPASDYDSIRNFFGRVHSAEQAPVVLVKK